METPPRTPLKTMKTYMKLEKKLLEIEVEVIQFTKLPTHTPGLDRLADDIEKKIAFSKKLLTAESASHDSTSHELPEIEGKLEELEAEYLQSNSHSDSHSAIVHVDDDSEHSSGSVCESCSERQVQIDAGNERWKVYENPAVYYEALMSPPSEESVVPLHEAVVPPSEMIREAVMMPRSDLEDGTEVSCVVIVISEKKLAVVRSEEGGGGGCDDGGECGFDGELYQQR